MLLQILQATPPWIRALSEVADAVAYTSMLLPAILAKYRKKSLRGGMQTMAYLPAYLFAMFLFARIGTYVFSYNLFVLHLSTIGESLLFIKIYHDEFVDIKIKQNIKIAASIFMLFALIDSGWLEGLQRINSYTNLMESIIVIYLALLFLDKNIIQLGRTRIHLIPMFVATAGIIIYLSGTIVLYLVTNYFIALNDEFHMRLIYLFSSASLLLLSVLLSRAFLLVRPVETQLP
ncbi:hypothetical protein [Hymenobacter psychrophilus]|uniref:Uncharacterized protein n=1 Tax=Hymenobacter psychrophilus TaxID=651662 RepID=A0A1H3GWR7_9BACT|nr:hypothetical protein [Hymenobacter psychrophilus]SDY07681.1 hypothetical protein SAMN04488069_105202 [Hymenobacter psychrophilus]